MKKYFLCCPLVLLTAVSTGCSDSSESQNRDNLPQANQSVSTGERSVDWSTDYQQALNDARRKQRRILVNFTGSDWCGWCIRLKKEVFDTEDFKKYAEDKLVLLEIDFPRRKQLPPAHQQANRELMEKFGVQGFPTLFLLNPDGKAIGQLGYTPGGPKAFISALESAEG